MTVFTDLPDVLCDLCTVFAFGIPSEMMFENIKELLSFKYYNFPHKFFRPYVISTQHYQYVTNPLYIYTPFWEYANLFDENAVRTMLCNLDFRKRCVKQLGSRHEWFHSFSVPNAHENYVLCGLFYNSLIKSGVDIWTPTYHMQLKYGSTGGAIGF